MSKYSVIVTKPAADDAIEIIRYISDNLKNKKAAERHLELYLDTLHSLREMPGIYGISTIDGLYERGIRLAPCGNFDIAFTLDEQNATVTVLRVLYAMSDLGNKFNDE